MFRNEELYCLHDAGRRVNAIGRFVTSRGERVELAQCPFDGYISGFHWTDESGWEPVFLGHEDSQRKLMVVSLWPEARGQAWNQGEIAFELECFFDQHEKRPM